MRDHVYRQRARQKRRQKIGGCLEDRGITQKTRERYFSAVRQVLPRLQQAEDIDAEVGQWVEERFAAGASITSISDTLCGLQHYCRGLKNQLTAGWRLFKIWRRVERPKQAPPLPYPVFLGLLGSALQFEDLELAVLLSLGFWGMLRTGEMLQLTKQQVFCGTRDLVVQLGYTKTGLRRAIDENVQVSEPIALLICKTYFECNHKNSNEKIWSRTNKEFREAFDQLLLQLKLGTSFRPYSLRRGGATHDFRSHGSMERTLLRGRWATGAAARVYVQEGLSALTQLQISKEAAERIKPLLSLFAWICGWAPPFQGGPSKGSWKKVEFVNSFSWLFLKCERPYGLMMPI